VELFRRFLLVKHGVENVMSAGRTRQKPTKKRSLCVINEHFEEDFNAVLSGAIVFQQPANVFTYTYNL
jgi:hypothetical protein